MSLDFNYSKVADKSKCVRPVADATDPDAQELTPVLQAMIWGCMATGIGKITEQDAPEIAARLQVYEAIHGTFVSTREGPRPLTLEDVRDFIGLSTNVFPKESRAAWLKRIVGGHMDETLRRAARAEREAKAS